MKKKIKNCPICQFERGHSPECPKYKLDKKYLLKIFHKMKKNPKKSTKIWEKIYEELKKQSDSDYENGN